MREEELRSGAAKRRTFNDGTWNYLRDRGYVSEALDKGFDEEAIQYIVDEIDALAEAYPYDGSRIPSGEVHTKNLAQELEDPDGEQGDYFEVELGNYETERKRAHAEVLARLVSNEKEVIEFRRDFLGGKLLTAEQAYNFLESPATRYFGPDCFEAWKIPLIGHKAEIVEYDDGWGKSEIDHRVSVSVDPPGIVKKAQYAPHWVPAIGDGTVRKVCSYADLSGTQAKHPSELPLTYRDREGYKATVYPWSWSVLDELRVRCNRLARSYSWEVEDMTWLFLTGEAPRFPALKMQVKYTHSGPRITLTAAPWIPSDVLKRNFEKAQKLRASANRLATFHTWQLSE